MRMLVSLVVVVCLRVAVAEATEPTQGTLRTRDGKTVVDVPLERTEVKIRVSGYLVDAEVIQVFKNPYPRKIEALYLFPLPDDAAVNEMDLVVGGRSIRGEIRKREEAKREYQRAKKAGHVAALLEQERPNLFTQQVANLEPGASVKVRIRYVQPLVQNDGGYELVFPMVAPPRFVPEDSTAKRDASRVQPRVLPPETRSAHEIALSVELDAGVPLSDLASPSHRLDLRATRGEPRVGIRLAGDDRIPNKDFVLRWRVAGAAPAFALLAHRRGTAPGSFYLFAQPPKTAADAVVAPREVIFVVDTSSSMRGAPLAKAVELVEKVLRGLRPDDTFQVVRFDDRASALGPRLIASKPANVERALAWLSSQPARGGTSVTTGIEAALGFSQDPARLRLVVFVTDGFVGNEDEILALVQARMGAARLFAFGVGSAVNRYLLEEMAALGRGTAAVVRTDEDAAAAVEAFRRRIDRAVLTDLSLDWGGLPVSDVTPGAMPDLFVGQPVVVSGHFTRPAHGTLTVRGKQAGRDVRFEVPVTLPEDLDRPAVATVWARAQITELSRRLYRKDDALLVRKITELALVHRLMSRYTAFVAVDASRTTAGGEAIPVAVPVEVPEGLAMGETRGGFGFGLSGVGAGGGGSGFGTIGLGSYGTIGHGSGTAIGYGAGAAGAYSSGIDEAAVYGGLIGNEVGETAKAKPKVPQVRLATVSATGSLDKNVLRRYVRQQLPRIKHCYEKQLLITPALQATAVAKFSINADGTVTVVAVEGTGHEPLENCISDVIHSIRFPKVTESGAVNVTYPFELKPEE